MKKEIIINDEFTVDFIKNANGGKPVCRIEGRVAFIDNSVKSFVAPCSTWIVRVLKVSETCLTVQPLVKVRTPKENEVIIHDKLELLKQQPKVRKAKVKTNFQYKSFQELKHEKES